MHTLHLHPHPSTHSSNFVSLLWQLTSCGGKRVTQVLSTYSPFHLWPDRQSHLPSPMRTYLDSQWDAYWFYCAVSSPCGWYTTDRGLGWHGLPKCPSLRLGVEWGNMTDSLLIIYGMGKRQLSKRKRGSGKTQITHIQAIQSTERNLKRQRGMGS